MKKFLLGISVGTLVGLAAFSSWWLFSTSGSRQIFVLPPEEKSYIRYTLYRGDIRDEREFDGIVQSGDSAYEAISVPSSGFKLHRGVGTTVSKGEKLYTSKNKDYTAKSNAFVMSCTAESSVVTIRLFNFSKTHVLANLPADMLAKLADFSELMVFDGETELAGKLSFVSPQTSFVKDIQVIEVGIACEGALWFVNTPVKIVFCGDSAQDVLFVYKDAIVTINSKAYLRVRDAQGQVDELPITTGFENREGYIQVYHPDLEAGMEILGDAP